MNKNKRSELLERYLVFRETGKDPYFDAEEIDDLLDKFENENDYTYYDEILELGLRLHPLDTDLRIRKCRVYVDDEKYEKALKLIDQLGNTEEEEIYLLLIDCFCGLGQFDKVFKLTEELIASNSDSLESVFEYTAPLLSEYPEIEDQVEEYINKGLLLFPDNLILKDELCYTLEMKGDIEKAIVICNQLIDNSPYSKEFWLTLGRLYSSISDFDKAIEAFDFALTCNGEKDSELIALKSYCLYMNESYDKALEGYKEIEDEPEISVEIGLMMAECYIRLEDYEKGYRLLKHIMEDMPDFEKNLSDPASFYINYSHCCAKMERNAEALQTLEKAAKQYPDDMRVIAFLAITHMENQQERSAIDAIDKLFKIIEHWDQQQKDHLEYLDNIINALESFPLNDEISQDQVSLFLNKFGNKFDVAQSLTEANKPIVPTENLIKEFLRNKDNNN